MMRSKGSILGRLEWAWDGIDAVGDMLWPARFTMTVILALGALLILVPQAQDTLYGAFTQWRYGLCFLVATVMVASNAWYWTRLLYDYHRNQNTPRGQRHAQHPTLATWLPRALGGLVFGETAIAITRTGFYWGAAGLVVLGGLFLVATHLRRKYVLNGAPSHTFKDGIGRWPTHIAITVIMGWAAAVILGLVTAGWLPWDLGAARGWLGLALVVIAAVASLLLAFRMKLPRATQWAVATLLLISLLLAVIGIYKPEWSIGVGAGTALMLAAATWIGTANLLLIFPAEILRLPITGTLLVLSLLGFGVEFALVGHDYGNHALRSTTTPGAKPVAS